jgi:acyl carrier protein
MDYQEHLGGRLPLVLAFASEPRFEWGPTLTAMGIAHVLLRDSTDQWYSSGIAGLGDVEAVVRYLQSLNGLHPCIALGISRGAHAALKFAKLAGIPYVVAISPNTGIGDGVLHEFATEWHHRVEHTRPFPIDDLKPFYIDGWRPCVRAFVSDGDGAELDRQMCERIGLTDVTFVPGYTHSDLGRGMRDIGLLDRVLSETIILIKLTKILRGLLKNESIILTMTTERQDVPRWDSLGYLTFIERAQDQFNMKFRLVEIESFQNVGEIVEVVRNRERH